MFMNDTYKKQFLIQYDLNDEYAFRFLYYHLHEHYDITYGSLGGIIDNRRTIDMFDKKNNEFTRPNSEISLSECSGCPSLTNTVSPREKNGRSSSNGYFSDDFALINNNMICHGRSRCMNDR
ncbi:hypothetical protein THOM_0410 [Trachipleistophora hominis]|uniref:Uncharacterized protein n=1 Tax=Trachipleistophora hominis TaxID=72359 RepID=L7JZ57_TRAHO|nr:hypothetical protein THOM_0410 [Trachipleistophora hominis]